MSIAGDLCVCRLGFAEGDQNTRSGGVRILWVSCLEIAHRTPLAGECPLFSAWGRFEDGAPASRVRYALWVAYPSGWLR